MIGQVYEDGGNQLRSRYFDELHHNLLSALDPWLMIPGRCPACWERLELTRDEVISWAQEFWMHDIWFWRCTQCDYHSTRDISTSVIAAYIGCLKL
jgi:hypothetical protein